jgi:hypothetical protein
MTCVKCQREFVALCGSRFLHPAKQLGVKIAPIYWWDGTKWHWAGTTATKEQLLSMVSLIVLPILIINALIYLNVWHERPGWCHPLILTALFGFITTQLIYFICWDFDFLSKRKTS